MARCRRSRQRPMRVGRPRARRRRSTSERAISDQDQLQHVPSGEQHPDREAEQQGGQRRFPADAARRDAAGPNQATAEGTERRRPARRGRAGKSATNAYAAIASASRSAEDRDDRSEAPATHMIARCRPGSMRRWPSTPRCMRRLRDRDARAGLGDAPPLPRRGSLQALGRHGGRPGSLFGGSRGRRAAVRGPVSLGVASGLANARRQASYWCAAAPSARSWRSSRAATCRCPGPALSPPATPHRPSPSPPAPATRSRRSRRRCGRGDAGRLFAGPYRGPLSRRRPRRRLHRRQRRRARQPSLRSPLRGFLDPPGKLHPRGG